MAVEVWTDGACSKRGQQIGGWAFIAYPDSADITEMAGWERPATSNQMELLAVIHAVRWCKRHHPGERIDIHTDSKYVTRQLRHERYDPDGDHTQNRLLWRQLDRLFGTDVRPTFHWTKGHDGDQRNERADRLAKQAQGGGTIYRTRRRRK